jgi:hypothetical protein
MPDPEPQVSPPQNPAPEPTPKVVPIRDDEMPKPPPITCASLKIGDKDYAGRVVHEIYFKRDVYVIYCTVSQQGDRQVRVQYADDKATADKQIAEVAEIIPLRNTLEFLLAGSSANCELHYAQIAEAFRLGLEHKPEVAKLTLEGAIVDVQNIRASEGRSLYVNKAWPLAAGGALVLLVIAAALLWFGNISLADAWGPLAQLALSCSAGALGALFSIAISVRARTVAIDGNQQSIRVDASLRVLIGVISAGILYLVLGTGALSQIKFGDMALDAKSITWQIAVLVGVASGFLERLVPDMLERKTK